MTGKSIVKLFAIAASIVLFAGCAAEPSAAPTPIAEGSLSSDSNGLGEETPESNEKETEGEYDFGTNRDQMATAIEGAFSNRNANATWQGSLLILAIDGDATETMAGFSECRVLDGLLNESDSKHIKFPNGTVDCADVLID